MCMFYQELSEACSELLEKGDAFDVIDVRNRVRDLCPHDNITFRTVKYELYTYFEQGNMPGFIIGTKNITDDMGSTRSVIEFRPDPSYVKPTGNIFDNMQEPAAEVAAEDAPTPSSLLADDDDAESRSWRSKMRDFFCSGGRSPF